MKNCHELQPLVCVTGQHREMLDQVLEVFGVVPDVDLQLMEPNQMLASLTARGITTIDTYLRQYRPDMILIQGDTTSVFCASIAAFYNRIPVGHVEAGLRTWNKYSPYPEEINRVLTSHVADYHFAPTEQSRKNLINEGIDQSKIYVTGNTVIDALFIAVEKIKHNTPQIPGLSPEFADPCSTTPIVLITGHRRENFGEGFESICNAISILAKNFSNTEFIYPVHLNPNVREPVFHILSGLSNVHLIEPLSYLPFVALMSRATVILTDSGGVQEEAPSLGKPVLVMRDTTERPEAVDAGTAKLVGTDVDLIVKGVSTLLTDQKAYEKMAKTVNPYGDGKACKRIVQAIKDNNIC
jgi:UDP-N-acetylglucosamine 2-epimerase (non-hydrolysing)